MRSPLPRVARLAFRPIRRGRLHGLHFALGLWQRPSLLEGEPSSLGLRVGAGLTHSSWEHTLGFRTSWLLHVPSNQTCQSFHCGFLLQCSAQV